MAAREREPEGRRSGGEPPRRRVGVRRSEYLQVLTALPDRDAAGRMARAVVERRLAACAQVAGPVDSTYRWKGAVEQAEEWLCLMKTTARRYAALEAAVLEMHPYETPEVMAVPVAAGSAAYLRWVAAAVRDPEERP